MYAPARTRGRAPAALLSLCLGLTSACSDEPAAAPDAGPPPDATLPTIEVPLGASLPPLAYTLSLTYANELIGPRPETMSGHLYLDVAADGQVTGAISVVDTGAVGLAMISGRVEGAETVILEGQVDVPPFGTLELEELRFVLLDGDGDGATDAAKGQASGSWEVLVGDIIDNTTHTSTLAASLDTTATSGSLYVPHFPETLVPFEAVHVRFEEPLREADVRENLRILAGGTALTGALTMPASGAATAGLVTEATFQPDAFLPFGAELTIDFVNLKDPSGNALAVSDSRVPVVADPGLLTDNAGFESELDGWLRIGNAAAGEAFEGFAPVEGAAQAVVSDGSTLAGVLDVPADATELDLSVAVITVFAAAPDPEQSIVIGLRKPGGELIEIFDLADVFDQLQDCATCTRVDDRSVGPVRRTLDLTPHRGQRVFLTVEVRSYSFFGDYISVALVDDIQIR